MTSTINPISSLTCIACGQQAPTDTAIFSCPKCGDLYTVTHDWDRSGFDGTTLKARFEERLGPWLVYCDTVRKTDGDEIFGTGPTGQVVPGYIAKGGMTAVRNGDDAVLEYALLTRSDLLVHNVSSLSYLAQFSVPESIHV